MAHASGANSMNGIKVIKPYPLIKLPSARTAARRATISDTSGVAQTPPRRTALSADDKLYPVEFSQGGFPPNLEEFIPEPLLPENLLVIAELECLEGDTGRFLDGKNFKPKQQSASATAVKHKYRRVLPAIPLGRSPAHRKGTANLWLSEAGLCGVGHHSSVHKAHFRLPEPLATNSRSKWNGRTSVIAKLAFSNEENPCQASNQASDREHLLNEAKVFDQLTKNHPRLQHAHYKVDRDRSRNRYLTRMAAVVPKFYGYYLPVGSDVEKLSPILLIEDCGVPIKLPLSYENTLHIQNMFSILHDIPLIHNSPHLRNILVQPGPLHLEPSERSDDHPVYRIIDFGRSIMAEASSGLSMHFMVNGLDLQLLAEEADVRRILKLGL